MLQRKAASWLFTEDRSSRPASYGLSFLCFASITVAAYIAQVAPTLSCYVGQSASTLTGRVKAVVSGSSTKSRVGRHL